MEWLPIRVSLCHRDCSYHQEFTQAAISQHPLTPIMANGLPDEASGVIPALMINNIKMRTLSILQSFWYKEPENVLPHYGRERETLQIIRPLRSGPGACLESLSVNEWNRLRRQFIPGWWIQNTNCCLPCVDSSSLSIHSKSNELQHWNAKMEGKKNNGLLSLFISYSAKAATPQKTFHFCWLVIRLWRECHVSDVFVLLKPSVVIT